MLSLTSSLQSTGRKFASTDARQIIAETAIGLNVITLRSSPSPRSTREPFTVQQAHSPASMLEPAALRRFHPRPL
jgi:hypothetical protein